jgi:peptidoglycan/LPS O-acetylase OafA/YrhL
MSQTLIFILILARFLSPLMADAGISIPQYDGLLTYSGAFETLLWGGLAGLHKDVLIKKIPMSVLTLNSFYVFIFVTFAMVLFHVFRTTKPFSYIAYWAWPSAFSLGALLIVVSALAQTRSTSTLIFNPISNFVGSISYSLYLFQQFILSPAPIVEIVSIYQLTIAIVLLIFGCSFWFYLIERPMTVLGERIFPRFAQKMEIAENAPKSNDSARK